jgi:hypothetical protein
MNKLDKKGVTARNLYNEIATEGKTYNERRSQQTARMRSALKPVWAALKSGTPVNGQTTIEGWCRWATPNKTTKYPERWFQKVMGEVSSPRSKTAPPITAHFDNVQFDENEAYCVIDIEQKRDLKYQGKHRDSGDYSLPEDNGNAATQAEYEALNKENKIVWTHTIIEVSGQVTVTVENEDGTMTEKELLAALRKKMTVTLKSMRLWADHMTKEFNAFVKETADWHEEKAERRSHSAKKAAKTRKARAPQKVEEPKKKKRFNLKRSLALTEANETPDLIRVKLTKAQMREVEELSRKGTPREGVFKVKEELRFPVATYQGKAKELVLGLEARIKSLADEMRAKMKDGELSGELLDWNNKDEAALAAKKDKARLEGAIKACYAAIEAITDGDLDSDEVGHTLSDWVNAREGYDLSEPAKALAAAVDDATANLPLKREDLVVGNRYEVTRQARSKTGDIMLYMGKGDFETEDGRRVEGVEMELVKREVPMPLTWAQKVCIPGSPEREQWSKEVRWRKEHPSIDPNAGDEFAGEGD